VKGSPNHVSVSSEWALSMYCMLITRPLLFNGAKYRYSHLSTAKQFSDYTSVVHALVKYEKDK
jgi:hypothetical protein